MKFSELQIQQYDSDEYLFFKNKISSNQNSLH